MSTAVETRKDERARRKAERMMEKQREAAEHDLPRSMRPSPVAKTITVIVLVVALIYFLFPIYWAIIASTKTPSQLTSSNGLPSDLTRFPTPSPPTIRSSWDGPVVNSGVGC